MGEQDDADVAAAIETGRLLERERVRTWLQAEYTATIEGVERNRRARTKVYAYSETRAALQRIAARLNIPLYP